MIFKTGKGPRTSLTAPALCPHCGAFVDRASDMFEAAAPRPGDLSLCMTCGEICLFDADLRLKRPAPGEVDRLLAEDAGLARRIAALRAAWAATRIARAVAPPGRAN